MLTASDFVLMLRKVGGINYFVSPWKHFMFLWIIICYVVAEKHSSYWQWRAWNASHFCLERSKATVLWRAWWCCHAEKAINPCTSPYICLILSFDSMCKQLQDQHFQNMKTYYLYEIVDMVSNTTLSLMPFVSEKLQII